MRQQLAAHKPRTAIDLDKIAIARQFIRSGFEWAKIGRQQRHRLLKDSAPCTDKLVEPHPPLPKTEENPDILHVTRTWNFLPGGSLVDE